MTEAVIVDEAPEEAAPEPTPDLAAELPLRQEVGTEPSPEHNDTFSNNGTLYCTRCFLPVPCESWAG